MELNRKYVGGSKDIAQVNKNIESPITHFSLKAEKKRGKNRKIKLENVFEWSNLLLADANARKGKTKNHYGVKHFDKDWWKNMVEIQQSLVNKTFNYEHLVFEKRYCDYKYRILAKTDYKNHIVEHALMNICGPIIQKSYYYESSASIPGRGIHYTQKHVRKFIDKHINQDLWWVQLDFKKCYHNVSRKFAYDCICKMFNDDGIRWLFHKIIYALGNHNGLQESDGSTGMGIGLVPIQSIVNMMYNQLDRKLSSIKGVKVFRYCDNILMLGVTPKVLQKGIEIFLDYSENILHQPVHKNFGIQKLNQDHPVDFVGYKFYKDYTFIRNSIKKRFIKKCKVITDPAEKYRVMSSYKGWLMHANGLSLWSKYTGMLKFSDLNLNSKETIINGKRYFEAPVVSASFLVNRSLIVKDYEDNIKTKNGNDRICVLVEESGKEYKFITNNIKMKLILAKVRELDKFPFSATLRAVQIPPNITSYYFE